MIVFTAASLLCHSSVGFSPLPTLVHKQHTSRLSGLFVILSRSLLLFQSQTDDDVDDNTSPHTVVSSVTLKMAFDENWAVADDAEIISERFTSPSSLDLVHRLRRDSDAVVVGRSTVQRDNCTLTVRCVPSPKKQPVRVVVDPNLSLLDGVYALFQDGLETIVYCNAEKSVEKKKSDNEFRFNHEVTNAPVPTDHHHCQTTGRVSML